jgi:hypothetical protein
MTRRRRFALGALLLPTLAFGCMFSNHPVRTSTGPDEGPVTFETPLRKDSPSAYRPQVVQPRETKEAPPKAPQPTDPLPTMQVRTVEPPPAPPPSDAGPVTVANTTPEPRPAPEPPLVVALRELVEHHPARALELLQSTERASPQETLALLRAAVLLDEGSLERTDAREVARLLEQLDDCRARLRGQAPLTLQHLCFYRGVASFGNVDALPPDPAGPAFQAGCDSRHGELAKVYVEVRNFRFAEVRNPDDQKKIDAYEARLAGSLTILDSRGGLVSVMDFKADPDHCTSPRHDMYITFDFHVPPRTPPGAYTLKVQVRDLLSGSAEERTAQGELEFRVVSGSRTARRE